MIQSRKAYVLTCNTKSDRAIYSQQVLCQIGFDVNLIQCINEGYSKTEKILSNRLGMTKIFELIEKSKDNYGYVFEDDLNIVENIQLSEIIEYEQISKIFFYLGMCSDDFSTVKNIGRKINNHTVYSISGNVSCLHGIGLSKKGAEQLLKFSENKDTVMDLILGDFSKLYPANIVRFDLSSPLNKQHRGVIYQDRMKFPTTIQ